MKKLRLQLDKLQVDSFATDGLTQEVGTVHGHVTALRCSTGCETDGVTCDGGGTCNGAYSCNGEYSCQLSCTDCGTYYCITDQVSCGQLSCVDGCTSANPYGCGSCG
jgi:hypothetical protein